MDEQQQEERKLIDASEVVPQVADWAGLKAEKKVKFYQGEPESLERFDLPEFDPRRVAPIAGLDLCLVQLIDTHTWAMAPARKDVNPWWVAAAYVRMGYVPPLALVDMFGPYHPNLIPDETRRVISVIKAGIQDRMDRLIKINATLTAVQKKLAW